MNVLETKVKSICDEHIADYDDPQEFINDLMSHGCISGMIGELIYYSDTMAFYETHKENISALLAETMDGLGADSPRGVFGDKWDASDPLILEGTNQNLLAWFAFEETANRLYN